MYVCDDISVSRRRVVCCECISGVGGRVCRCV